MSLPARMGTNVSASALVRVKCGSMWITLAPRAFASTTHWNPTGWASAMFEPMITMQGVDEPVRSVGGAATPERGEQLLDQVVLFVVQRGPAQAREPGGAPQDPALGVGLLPAAAAGVEHP